MLGAAEPQEGPKLSGGVFGGTEMSRPSGVAVTSVESPAGPLTWKTIRDPSGDHDG